MLLIRQKVKNKYFIAVSIVVAIALLSIPLWRFDSAQAVFPTNVGVLDDFNRANAGGLGANWSNDTLGNAGSTSFSINSNRAAADNSVYSEMWWNASTFGPDSEAYVTLTRLADGTGYTFGLMIRTQNPGDGGAVDGYRLQVSSTTTTLIEVTNGVESILTSSPNVPVIDDKYGIEAIGTTIKVHKFSGGVWSELLSYTDNTAPIYTDAGNIGLWAYNGAGGTIGASFDDFSGGTVIPNAAPSAPTLSLPANSATDVSITPEFQLRTTDADDDDLQYRIQVCSTADCSVVVRTIDQTSSQTGWTGQDQQTNTAYTGNSTITSSTMAVHTYQAPELDYDTEYWWRAYAIDPDGTNTFSSASSIMSFTTGSAAAPPAPTPPPASPGSSPSPTSPTTAPDGSVVPPFGK